MKKNAWICRLAAAALGVLLCLPMGGCAAKIDYTMEAGDDLPDPFDLFEEEGGSYVPGYDPTLVDRPGTYTLAVTNAAGKVYELTLTVRDTTRPVLTTRHLYYALGGQAPFASDFIDTIKEIDTYEAYFTEDPPTTDKLGDFDVVFQVKDASGNESLPCHSLMTVIEDNEGPVFHEVPPISTHIGSTVNYLRGVEVTDNCVGEVTVTVDHSAVDMTTEGIYPVYYTAADPMGNLTKAETVLRVYAFPVSEDQVYAEVDDILQEITTPDMTKAQKMEALHHYLVPLEWGVERPVDLVGDAAHTDWVRAAYEALIGSEEADAFGYASVAKAFCTRLGLDHHLVQRAEGKTADTHYWLLINIGTERDPRWYHYDCTPLSVRPANNGCFMTDAQLSEYSQQRRHFYAFDSGAYPASAQQDYIPSLGK